MPFGRVSFSLFFLTARDALATLLRVHGKEQQAAAVLRAELTTLNLYNCRIGDDGAEIVAAFLKHDETVVKVFLHSCYIGARGVKAIAEALKHNQTLWFLNLYANQIGEEGASALIDALSYNVCMEVLDFSHVASELQATIEYLTETRNKILIPAAVRRASLSLIAARRNITDAGNLAAFQKEIVRMIAMEVWATRKEPIWINALSESERTGESGDE